MQALRELEPLLDSQVGISIALSARRQLLKSRRQQAQFHGFGLEALDFRWARHLQDQLDCYTSFRRKSAERRNATPGSATMSCSTNRCSTPDFCAWATIPLMSRTPSPTDVMYGKSSIHWLGSPPLPLKCRNSFISFRCNIL